MALGRELAAAQPDERALRILADHSRALTFLIADGVVPSNEDRGYILRRIMRRAIQQGRRIGIAPGFLPRFVEQVIETMGGAYPELHRERDSILLWARSEEEASVARSSRARGCSPRSSSARASDPAHPTIPADAAFQLHDTFGFPIEVTTELRRRAGARGRRRRLRRAHGGPARARRAAARAATAAPVA